MKRLLLRYVAIALFLLVALATRPYFYADTFEYAQCIVAQEEGKSSPQFFEASHLIWRPLGLAVHSGLAPVLTARLDLDRLAQVSLSLILISVVLTLIGIVYFYRLLRLLPIPESSVQVMALLFVASQCVMNFSRTGTSYMAGISTLIVGLYYVFTAAQSLPTARRLILPGLLLALAPLLWVPYLLALPAAVLVFPFVNGWTRKNIMASLKLSMIVGMAAAILLLPTAAYLRLTPMGFVNWMLHPGQIRYNAGPLRTFFGLPKLLFYLGDDGLYVKRFLYHDPYNPVSVATLLSLGLWKIALFYVSLVLAFFTIWHTKATRKYLLFITAGIIPTIVLSLQWDGAALERHMPLEPFLFVAFALGFAYGSKYVRSLLLVVSLVALLLNAGAMWYATAATTEGRVAAQIGEIWPRLNEHSMVTVLNIQDGLVLFQRIHPLHTYNQSNHLRPYPLMGSIEDSMRFWLPRFERTEQECWSEQGAVWVNKSLLAASPGATDYWIENETSGISWRSISSYFRSQHYSDSTEHFLLLRHELP